MAFNNILIYFIFFAFSGLAVWCQLFRSHVLQPCIIDGAICLAFTLSRVYSRPITVYKTKSTQNV